MFTARYDLNLSMQFKFIFIFRTVSRRPFAAEARIKSQISPSEICDGQSVHCSRFCSEYFGFPLPVISPLLHSQSSSAPCCYQDKRPKSGNLSESNAYSEIGEHWIETNFRFFFLYFVDRASRYKFLLITTWRTFTCVYIFRVSTCFERHSAHHQEIKLC